MKITFQADLNKDSQELISKRIDSILTELSLAEINLSMGSGLGGNIEYYLALLDNECVVTNEVKNLEKTETTLKVNPDFIITSSKKDVRAMLDSVIEPFKISVEKVVDDFSADIKNINVAELLDSGAPSNLFGTLNERAQLALALQTVQLLSDRMKAEQPSEKMIDNFSNVFKQFSVGTMLFAVRTVIGITNSIKYNLPDNDNFQATLGRVANDCSFW